MAAVMRLLAFCIIPLLIFASNLHAHGNHGTHIHNHVSVHVDNGWGGHYWHGGGRWHYDRVYYTDPWYHPHHVYIYGGDPYALYYYGYPYYYFDPRFYYFQ